MSYYGKRQLTQKPYEIYMFVCLFYNREKGEEMIGIHSWTNYRSLKRDGGRLEQLTYHDGICKSYGHLAVGLVGPVASWSSEHGTQQDTGSRAILMTQRFLIIKNARTILVQVVVRTNKYSKQKNSLAQHFQTKRNVMSAFALLSRLLHHYPFFKATFLPTALSESTFFYIGFCVK